MSIDGNHNYRFDHDPTMIQTTRKATSVYTQLLAKGYDPITAWQGLHPTLQPVQVINHLKGTACLHLRHNGELASSTVHGNWNGKHELRGS